MRHIFIINPHAGKGTHTAALYAMADQLRERHGLTVECLLTDRPGGAEAMARRLGLPVFHLDTYARNDRMQALIRSQGFTQVGQVHFDREGRPDGFPCFEKVL